MALFTFFAVVACLALSGIIPGVRLPNPHLTSPCEGPVATVRGDFPVAVMEAPASGVTLQVDAELAIGPTRHVLVTNAGVSLRNKSDGSQDDFKALNGAFFSPANKGKMAAPHIGDPDVIYDQRAERFWVVAIEVDFAELISTLPCFPNCPITKGWLHVAVSPDDDPSDLDWEVFTFDIQGEPFEDVFDGLAHFLNIATDDDYLYIACTDSVDRSNFGTWRTTVLILEKEPMLAEKDPTAPDLEWIRLHQISQTWGHAIGTKDWAGSSPDVMYLVAPANPPLKEADQYQTHMNVVALYLDDDEWMAEAFPDGIELPAPYFEIDSVDGAPVPALPMGCTGTPKMSLVQSACIHGVQHGTGKSASLWTTLHCREDIKSEPGQYNVVRWFEISLNGWPFEMDDPEFRQAGQIDGIAARPAWHTYDPSIAVNSRGDMAITCTQSGGQTAQYARTYFGLRCAGDTLGTVPVQGVVTELESTVSLLNLKADYSGTAMDPEDDDIFWSHSILSKAPSMGCPSHWQSWLAQYEIGCSDSNRACYADCDSSTGSGVLDIFDFLCFGNSFDQGNAYACDCDTTTGVGVCDVFDFLCFGNAFNAGCP